MKTKQILLILGALITVSCAFLPLFSSCAFDGDNFAGVNHLGGKSSHYYKSFFLLVLIVMFGYFGEGSASKITTIICTLFGGAFFLFFVELGKAGWGAPCGNNPTGYFYLLIAGHLLIIVASFISLYTQDTFDEEQF